jgi:hypothetical protein
MNELDIVILNMDLPEYGLKPGTEGTIVDVLGGGMAYTVEFFTSEGETIEVVTVQHDQITQAIGVDAD